jgi:hypothetical protein
MTISEDDGLNKNRVYNVKVVAKVGKRDFTFAEAKMTTK